MDVFKLFNNIKSYIKIISGSIVGLVLMFFTYKYKSAQNENKNLKKEKNALKNTIEVGKKKYQNEIDIKDMTIAVKTKDTEEDKKVKKEVSDTIQKAEGSSKNEKIIFEA